jgi:hypothetical protein
MQQMACSSCCCWLGTSSKANKPQLLPQPLPLLLRLQSQPLRAAVMTSTNSSN